MRKVVLIGVGMHPCGKFLDKSLKDLGQVAIWNAIDDAGIDAKEIEVAYVSNCVAGLITGEENVRGQRILRAAGIGRIPVINVENACAAGSTALRGAYLEVASGLHDIAIAVGAEKMFCGNTSREVKAIAANADLELLATGVQFTALYAISLKKYMKEYGATPEHFAKIAVKNSYNGSLNPYAQHRTPLTIEQVLNSRMISDPLTLYMCCSIADGAAAVVLCTEEVARKHGSKPLVEIAACELGSGRFRPEYGEGPDLTELVAEDAYRVAGIPPEDIDVAEVHDAMAPAELLLYEELGFCKKGEAIRLIDEGRTKINGDIPVNPSGGLAAKGHPIGATGLIQVAEIVWQLRGEAGPRQVAHPKVGLIQNRGGFIDGDDAASAITILKR
jgi:acetyl-CoA acetyltransferase